MEGLSIPLDRSYCLRAVPFWRETAVTDTLQTPSLLPKSSCSSPPSLPAPNTWPKCRTSACPGVSGGVFIVSRGRSRVLSRKECVANGKTPKVRPTSHFSAGVKYVCHYLSFARLGCEDPSCLFPVIDMRTRRLLPKTCSASLSSSRYRPPNLSNPSPEPCAPDGMLSEATDCFLNFVDFVVGWAHYLSAVSMPWGGGVGEISCVSAIYLAIFVRLVVSMAFSGVRVVLGLPVRSFFFVCAVKDLGVRPFAASLCCNDGGHAGVSAVS